MYIYHIFCIHLFDVHFGWFHILAIVNSAAVNMFVQISFWYTNFLSFGYIPSSGIAGSHSGSIFSFSHMPVGHIVFFWYIIQIIYLFLNQISCCFLLNCLTPFCVLVINPLLDGQFVNIFSHSVCCLFTLLIVSFPVQKLFSWCNSICLVCFCFCAFEVLPKKCFPRSVSSSVSLMFYSFLYRDPVHF